MNKILLLAFIFNYSVLSAQVDDRVPKVITPTPNAAALQRYGDIPVSPYTGVPTISIPLYEIKSGDISVPISISYNASGIKVADEASHVGLGWALNAGGAISRNIIFKDDWKSSYQTSTFDIPMGAKHDQGYNVWINCLMSLNGQALPQADLNNGLTDYQPDIYSYNFNGHTGKFVLRRNKDVILNKIEKLDIKVLDNDGNAWEVKTPDGFLYLFQDIETYWDENANHNSSWYLSKITSPTGKVVQFIYEAINTDIQPVGSYFESHGISFSQSGCGTNPELPPLYGQIINAKSYHSLHLSKIISDDCEADFDYSTGRTDVLYDVQLDDIKIYSKKTGQSNSLIKSWLFNYAYFEGTNFNGWSSPTYPDIYFKRLKLASVQETSSSSSVPPYIFSYNNEDLTSKSLIPSKLSFARDHWGYFNGKLSNTSLIPTFIASNGVGDNEIGAMENERSCDPEYSQLFMLNKITYPTGGYTKFEYESNDFDEPNSIVNDHSFWAEYTAAIPVQLQGQLSNTNVSAGGTFTSSLDLSNMYPFSQNVKLEVYFININSIPYTQVGNIQYSFKNPDGSLISSGTVGELTGNTSPPMAEYIGGNQTTNSGVKMTLIKPLSPGVYTFTFILPSNVATAINPVANYTKGEGIDPIISSGDLIYNALFGGGVRIKRIYDYSSSSSVPIVRRYNYHYTGNDGKMYTYGRRMAKPNYSYYGFVPGGTSGSSDCYAECLFRESDSNIPLNSSTNGVSVGYDKVEEYYGENGENGKIVYEYLNHPDEILNYTLSGMPLKPPYGATIPYAGNGELIKQTTLANINSQFIKNKEVINTFLDVSDLNSSVVEGIEKRPVSSQGATGQECGIYSFYIYPALATNRFVLTSTTTNQYDVLGNNIPLSIHTDYTYNTTTHLQLTSQKQTKSDGNIITTNFSYPLDYSDATSDPAIMLMKGSAFMQALPITKQIILSKGNSTYLTEAEINKFQVLSNKVFPKEIAIWESNQPLNITNSPPLTYNPSTNTYPNDYTLRLSFDTYDAFGNITQFHKGNDIYHSYIWGYNNSYPIAEVVNAASNEVYFNSFEEDGTATEGNAYGGKKYHAGPYQVPFTKPNNKVYTVSYHYLQNGGWHSTSKIFSNNMTLADGNGIDDVKVYPSDAQMTTYTYDPLIGMTSQSDVNGRITYYEYDGLNRLSSIKDEDKKILKKYQYAYQSANPTVGGCDATTCNKQDEKCINGFCEKAKRINTSTTYIQTGTHANTWKCSYYLQWSDNSVLPTTTTDRLSEYNVYPCDVNQ